MEDISGKFRKWLLEKDKWGLPKRRADMCSDTLEIGFFYGYTIAQKELQEKLDAAIEVIRFYGNHSTWKTSEFSEDYKIEYKCRISSEEDGENTSESFIRGGKRARDFLKARGEK